MRGTRVPETSAFNEDLIRFYLMPMPEVVKEVRAKPGDARAEHVERLQRFFDSELVMIEKQRVAAVKMAIALLPATGTLIRETLLTFDRHEIYAVHFTFLCYMDDIAAVDMAFGREVPSLLTAYLSKVRLAKSHSAWTAAMLLGEHFPTDRGVALLEDVALHGNTAVGREMAVVALGKAMRRISGESMRHVEALVSSVGKSDKSKSVRAAAESVLRGVV